MIREKEEKKGKRRKIWVILVKNILGGLYISVGNYVNDTLNVVINYLPSNFRLYEETGDEKSGKLIFKSLEIYDETWGPYLTLTFSWISYPIENFHSGDAIQDILNLFAKLNMNLDDRINDYILGHFFQSAVGSRIILKKGTPYTVKEIHGILYCEHSQREISIIVVINNIQNIFPSWKDTIIRIIKSIKFH